MKSKKNIKNETLLKKKRYFCKGILNAKKNPL